MARAHSSFGSASSARALRCRRKFLRLFPGGFADETYAAWERDYKWAAHREWARQLGRQELDGLLERGEHLEIGPISSPATSSICSRLSG
jgi:hypothetical protein